MVALPFSNDVTVIMFDHGWIYNFVVWLDGGGVLMPYLSSFYIAFVYKQHTTATYFDNMDAQQGMIKWPLH